MRRPGHLGKSRFGHLSRVSSRAHFASGFDEGFFFSRAPAETANGASSWFAQTKDLWSPRTSHSRPQLFQSKWIGFAAPLAPGKIFTGGSWLEVAGASEPSVHVDSLPVIFGSRTVRL